MQLYRTASSEQLENRAMAERWTIQRRLEHTRSLLLDAAEEVFARKGFRRGRPEDIADAAGYARGAIYSRFGSKAGCFSPSSNSSIMVFLDSFADVVRHRQSRQVARRRHRRPVGRSAGRARSDRASLGHSSPSSAAQSGGQERVSGPAQETAHALADYIAKGVARLGSQLTMEAVDLARVVLAANDGVTLNSLVDGRDVYRPFLRMVIANIVAPPSK